MSQKSRKIEKQCFVKEFLGNRDKEIVRERVCKSSPKIYEHDGKSYCVFHSPSKDKIEDFNKEIQKKIENKDYNFDDFYFPGNITFSAPYTFEKGFSFMDATFAGEVIFFGSYEFELDFRRALFEENSQLIFHCCDLKGGLDLRNVTFRGHLRFEGGETMRATDEGFVDVLHLVFDGERTWLDMQYTIIEKPERVHFHTVRLQPSWFVNCDSRKFVFTDCRWMDANGYRLDTLEELDGIFMKNGVLPALNPHAELTKICKQLAENYESNKDYENSSIFWEIANESRRFEEFYGYNIFSLHWWYWLLSFYGERWKRAAFWLLILIGLFSIGYSSSLSRFANSTKQSPSVNKTTDEIEKQIVELTNESRAYRGMDFIEALFYALRIGALQRPEPQPENNFAKGLVTFETVFVPLQAALLALAIRRKFMR